MMNRRTIAKWLGLSPLVYAANPLAMAQGETPRRFLQVFLGGGWDSLLATDPVPAGSPKTSSGKFQAAYHDAADAAYVGAPQTVAGKGSLLVGKGLLPARPGFAQLPTAFVNGLFVEVTAHELAVAYLYSGVLSLSRSREYPAIAALMAARTGGFPAHVLLGNGMPLAATAKSYPPLQAFDTDAFAKMLGGPYVTAGAETYDPASIQAGHDLIASLNSGFQSRQGVNGRASLEAWNNGESGLGSLYGARYDQRIVPSDALLTSFGYGGSKESIGARLALACLIMKENLTRFVTVTTDGFDTHQNHLSTHVPPMERVAVALKALADFLATTNDPESPSLKLAETTTVLVTSEFNRTPLFNGAGGTDHWQTGSAILMGRGVRDNTIVGSTGAEGEALDYGGKKLLPDHLAASILRHLGFTQEADAISGVHLGALFT